MYKLKSSFLLFLLVLALIFTLFANTETSHGGNKFPKCIVGTYLNTEASGTRSLWTLAKGGTFAATSSAQASLMFSNEQGTWKKVGKRQIEIVSLDFSYGANGELINIARVDITLIFKDNRCQETEGEFVLRFFEGGEDPLNPATNTGEPILGTFEGRRVNVD